ncbi:MAG: NADH:ubiquinone reductase (Na(+)-transporting) subunit C [Planctomycetes bacterium]|nr:NADH:ubiquinone reductase (Na(+)-transporting) subunit C [Planctomycetota bacterium]MBT4029467.1 NADH:ubiquinone reductase (Na(+)-transporting) subunit C [Planctomycetota bacterium]MBT4560663.1 NADH:ubiquinone reductase (Na(+)-transporting) subunit C [Planctomycetota bacterium]MBT5102407.1 NADH:ubiquinone reductase (Na(+)-transporting) subunit C [Planctomycetota bacterium]MBT5119939.1 NADH:ubiquinone reductase (Na(+)-transporting) subunit C [Planctomycetota bacterium]
MDYSNKYIVSFSLAVCLVCALVVSAFAVGLKPLQEENIKLDKQQNLLVVAGITESTKEAVLAHFAGDSADILTYKVDRKTGKVLGQIEFGTFNPHEDASQEVIKNPGKMPSLPNELVVYKVTTPGKECWILPVWGKGLWSTLQGYISLEDDNNTIKGLTFYAHAETAGLGGEIDNPKWKALWPGKKAYDADGNSCLEVVKAGAPQSNPEHQIDGLSGATLTINGVTGVMQLWFGDLGYGPFLKAQTNKGN